MTLPSQETSTPSSKQTKEQVPEHLLLKEEVINDLDTAVRKSQDGEIGNLQLFVNTVNAWKKACQNPTLNSTIEKELRRRRVALHQMIPIDITKHGDPIKKRYDPNYWIGTRALKENPQAFLLGRIASLRNFFESL